jgi:hypothetical protein
MNDNDASLPESSLTAGVRWRHASAAFVLCALALALGHLLLVNYFAPLRAIFASKPIQGVDYDLHIGQVYRVVEGLRGWGKSWVYDVRLVAGQPEGTITDAGSKGWQLWTYAWTLAGVSLPIAFNTWVLLAMLACPLLAFAAARCFDLTPGASLAAAAMASALWFFDSFTHWVWFVGMVSWALASCLCPLTIGLFYRFVETRKAVFAVGCGACMSIGHLIHPYTFFVLLAPFAGLYIRGLRSFSWKTHLSVAAMALGTLLVNAYWLAVALRQWHYVLDSAFYAQGRISFILNDFIDVLRVGSDTGVIGVRGGFRVFFLASAIAGLSLWWRRHDRRALPLALGILGLTVFAYLGGKLNALAQIQPYRMLVASGMLSVVPAAFFFQSLDWRSFRQLPAAFQMLVLVLALSGVQHLAQQVLYFTPDVIPEVENFPDGSASPITKYGYLTRIDGPSHITYSVPHDPYIEPDYERCIQWLETNVREGSRLLVHGGVLGERIAWRTKLEVIGGFVERNVLHAYANYFRRYAEPPSPAVLAEYLRTYSIDYVVAIPQPSFDTSDALRIVTDVGRYRIYRTVRPTQRVLSGRGIVKAQTNRIDVSASDPSLPLVLSYHFHEALRCKPNCTIERETHTIDSVGLIRIPAPHPRAIRIYNAYP